MQFVTQSARTQSTISRLAMNALFKPLLAVMAIIVTISPMGTLHAAEPPDQIIKTTVEKVLNMIESGKVKASDLDSVYSLVDQEILPVVDIEKMTQTAIGRYWRDASPAQRADIVEEFKKLLINTYASAINQAKGAVVRYRPSRYTVGDSEAEVRSSVKPSGGSPAIEVSYRMQLANNSWKIYDLNVAGLWLGLSYRTTFARDIDELGLDGLIKKLRQKNDELKAKRGTK